VIEAYVCITRGKGWLAALERKILKSEYNHAFILYYSTEWQDWWAMEIDERGIVPVPAQPILKKQKKIRHFKCKKDLYKGLFRMKNAIGFGYDWKGIISGLTVLLLRRIGLNITKTVHSQERMFCSEYVTHVIEASGVPLNIGLLPHQTSPKDLLAFLESSPEFEEDFLR
jgi:hypothetical protein